jgi:prophage antirepressor-like protein
MSFTNSSFGSIRAFEKDGEIWFVAKDLAEALGYSETYAMTRRIDPEDKGKLEASTHLTGASNPLATEPLTTVNESGFYVGILGSSLPNAKSFRRWITSEVLPSIRKHGFYNTPLTVETMLADPRTAIKLLEAYEGEKKAKEKALEERDYAIKTKAWISNSREASAMGKASVEKRRAEKLAILMDQSLEYSSICRVECAMKVPNGTYSWRKLKEVASTLKLKVKKAKHLIYNEVNSYPAAVWKKAYAIDLGKVLG